jgi:Rrf2 family iron-sulfur cluster assembly transcriptional regulator
MKVTLAQSLSYHHDICQFNGSLFIMWLSSTAQQAIHATVCIADLGRSDPVRVEQIAAAIGSPRNYLSKTLHILARAGILRSGRGPRGGFQLALPADQVTLAMVMAPFEPVGRRRCVLGLSVCGDANPCAAHGRWKTVARDVDLFFNKTTVGSLMKHQSSSPYSARKISLSSRRPKRRPANETTTRR